MREPPDGRYVRQRLCDLVLERRPFSLHLVYGALRFGDDLCELIFGILKPALEDGKL